MSSENYSSEIVAILISGPDELLLSIGSRHIFAVSRLSSTAFRLAGSPVRLFVQGILLQIQSLFDPLLDHLLASVDEDETGIIILLRLLERLLLHLLLALAFAVVAPGVVCNLASKIVVARLELDLHHVGDLSVAERAIALLVAEELAGCELALVDTLDFGQRNDNERPIWEVLVGKIILVYEQCVLVEDKVATHDVVVLQQVFADRALKDDTVLLARVDRTSDLFALLTEHLCKLLEFGHLFFIYLTIRYEWNHFIKVVLELNWVILLSSALVS